jgi:methylmalonyl-CoA mutase N-terminal domain/subunit
VNRYQTDGAGTPVDIFRIDPAIEREQIARVRAVRAGRSQQACEAALAAVVSAARSGANLVPPIVDAVERFATLGEVADALRSVFGEHRETSDA